MEINVQTLYNLALDDVKNTKSELYIAKATIVELNAKIEELQAIINENEKL